MKALLLAAVLGSAQQDAAYRAALELLYDGRHVEALQRAAKVAADHPDDPIGPYVEALVLTWRLEQTDAEGEPDKEQQKAVARALALANARLAKDPADARAVLGRGAAYAVSSRAHMHRRRRRAATRDAVRMRRDLLAVRAKQPEDKDVAFGLGLYDYYADVLPQLFKMLRFLTSIPGGDKRRGLGSIEDAAGEAFLHRTEAQAQLYEVYAFYERKPDRALAEIRALHRLYPGWALWGLKLAEHLRDRLGRYAESARVARDVLRAEERRYQAENGTAAAALARLSWGESLLLDLRPAEARSVLLPIRDGTPGMPQPGPRARLLLGRSLEVEGDRDGALAHFRRAAASDDKDVRKLAQSALSSPMNAAEVKGSGLVAEARRLREAGQTAEAAVRYRQALAAWPRSREAALRVAEDDLDHGRLDDARQRLAPLLREDDPEPPWLRPWAWLLQARLLDLSGDREAALRQYKKVLNEPYGDDHLREQAERGLTQPFERPPAPAAARPAALSILFSIERTAAVADGPQ